MTETHTESSFNSKQVTTSPERPEVIEKQPSQPQPPPQKPKRGVPKPVKILGAIALIASIGYGVYRLFFYQPEPKGLFLSGRIEGYETDVAAKIGGRIAKVAVREGDTVELGQLLVKIDDAELQAQLQQAQAQVQASQKRLQQDRQHLPVLQAQLQQAELQTQQAKQESQGRVTEAKNSLAVVKAELEQAQAELELAQAEQRRFSQLSQQGAVSDQRRDQANKELATAKARVEAARQRVQAAEGQFTQAKASLRNVPIRAAAALQIQKQRAQARTSVSVVQQEVRSAQADQAEIQAQLNYLKINSPTDGSVITRSVEPGEVVAAGEPLLTLIELDALYLRGFIPEGQIGKVKLGQQARVYLDSFPNQPLAAKVTRVDPKASFTPENVYFKEDRVTQVFGIELTLKNPQGLAKPGMPVDARILVPEEQKRKRSDTLLPSGLGFLGQ